MLELIINIILIIVLLMQMVFMVYLFIETIISDKRLKRQHEEFIETMKAQRKEIEKKLED